MWELRNTVLIYVSDGFQYNPSVAGCGTPYDWKTLEDKTGKFKLINDKGGSIVFFGNSVGVNQNAIKSDFNDFMKGKDWPVIGLFATERNCFMKPFTNLWKVLCFMYQAKERPPPDLATSIYIGQMDGGIYFDKGGIYFDKGANGQKFKYRSDTDRAFAHNISLHFVSYTQFFFEKPEPKWRWNTFLMLPDDRMNYIKEHKADPEPNLVELKQIDKCLILVMGMPSSGRSTLIKRIISDLFQADTAPAVLHLSWPKSKYSNKTLKSVQEAIFAGTTIIKVDSPSYSGRDPLIEIAKQFDARSIVIHLTTPKNICKIMNFVKVQTTSDFAIQVHNNLLYKSWETKYEEPKYDDITVIKYPMVVRFRTAWKYIF